MSAGQPELPQSLPHRLRQIRGAKTARAAPGKERLTAMASQRPPELAPSREQNLNSGVPLRWRHLSGLRIASRIHERNTGCNSPACNSHAKDRLAISPPNPSISPVHTGGSPKTGEFASGAPNFGRLRLTPQESNNIIDAVLAALSLPPILIACNFGQCWFWVASAVRTLSGCEFVGDRWADAGHEDGQSPGSMLQTIPKDPEGAPHST